MKHVKTLNNKTLKESMKRRRMRRGARLPVSLHARLPLHRWQPELRERKQIIITIVSVKLE